jgi:hypothetical protein
MPLSLRESIAQTRPMPSDTAVLESRASMLSAFDRELLLMVMVQGRSAESLARLAPLSAKQIRRRVHMLSRRITSRWFLRTVRALPYLADRDARLARRRWCEGVSRLDLGRELGVSRHRLRRWEDRVRSQIETIHRLTHRSSEPSDRRCLEAWGMSRRRGA